MMGPLASLLEQQAKRCCSLSSTKRRGRDHRSLPGGGNEKDIKGLHNCKRWSYNEIDEEENNIRERMGTRRTGQSGCERNWNFQARSIALYVDLTKEEEKGILSSTVFFSPFIFSEAPLFCRHISDREVSPSFGARWPLSASRAASFRIC